MDKLIQVLVLIIILVLLVSCVVMCIRYYYPKRVSLDGELKDLRKLREEINERVKSTDIDDLIKQRNNSKSTGSKDV